MPVLSRSMAGTPPGAVDSTELEVDSFNTGKETANLRSTLPWVIVYNTDSSTHIITANPRAQSDIGRASVPFNAIPSQHLPIPTTMFALLIDGTPNGKCYWFYSDVPLTGPSNAAGGGQLTFPTGATISDDGNGGIVFKGQASGSITITRLTNLFTGAGNNLQLSQSGDITVYNTVQTSGIGLFALVGPTLAQPSDSGAVFIPLASSGTKAGAIFHPAGTKKLFIRICGTINIVTAGGGTWTPTVTYVDAAGNSRTRSLNLVSINGTRATTETVAGDYSIEPITFLSLAAAGGNAISVNYAVAGNVGDSWNGESTMEWGDGN